MVQSTRAINRGAVLTALLRTRPTNRRDLALATGLSAATVSRAVEELLHEGVVTEGEPLASRARGRRAVEVDVASDRAFVVGVDLGASRTRMGVADLLAHPIAAVSVETPAAEDGKALARWLGGAVRDLAAEHWSSVATVAVGVPGSVHHEARTIANAPNLTQVSDPDFVPCLERELGRPLVLDNDVNLAFLGEHRFGAARGCSDAAMVNLGAGLGTALAVDGRILRGRTGLVGEYGSLPFDGGRLEDFITGHGIMRKAREQGIDIADPSVLFHEDRRDLDGLREAFDRAMLTVLVAVTVAIEPAIIVLGGGVAQGSRSRLAGYQDLLDRQVHPAPPLALAGLRDFSGAAGAMVAALHEVYLELGVDGEALPLLPSTSVETFATLLAHQLAEGQSSRRDHS